MFAEVSSHFPLAGSVFQWTKLLSNQRWLAIATLIVITLLNIFGVRVVALIKFMWHRVATNPKPEETDGLLDFGVGFIDGLPIQWSVIGTVVLLGAICYALRGSHIPAPTASERPEPTPL